jgi:hypothetical protein
MTVPNNNTTLPYITPQLQKPQTSRWPLLLASGSIVVLIIALVFRLITPKQVPAPPLIAANYDNSTTTFRNVTYVGDPVNTPPSLPTGVASLHKADHQHIMQTLINKFQLQEVTNVSDASLPTLYTNHSLQMYYVSEMGVVQLSTHTIPQIPPTDKAVATEYFVGLAEALAAELYPAVQLTALVNEIVYLQTDGPEYAEASPSDANLISIPLYDSVMNYPLYYSHNLYPPLTVVLDTSGTVQRLVAYTEYVSFTPERQFPTISYTQALAQINRGNASIATAWFEGRLDDSMSEVVGGTLRSIALEYRMDPSTQRTLPYYRFTGILVNKSGNPFDAEVITPAVQTNFSR